jgi:hypothetical protein
LCGALDCFLLLDLSVVFILTSTDWFVYSLFVPIQIPKKFISQKKKKKKNKVF